MEALRASLPSPCWADLLDYPSVFQHAGKFFGSIMGFLSFFLSVGLWEQGGTCPRASMPSPCWADWLYTPLGFIVGAFPCYKVGMSKGPLFVLEVACPHLKLGLQGVCLLSVALGSASRTSYHTLLDFERMATSLIEVTAQNSLCTVLCLPVFWWLGLNLDRQFPQLE